MRHKPYPYSVSAVPFHPIARAKWNNLTVHNVEWMKTKERVR